MKRLGINENNELILYGCNKGEDTFHEFVFDNRINDWIYLNKIDDIMIKITGDNFSKSNIENHYNERTFCCWQYANCMNFNQFTWNYKNKIKNKNKYIL